MGSYQHNQNHRITAHIRSFKTSVKSLVSYYYRLFSWNKDVVFLYESVNKISAPVLAKIKTPTSIYSLIVNRDRYRWHGLTIRLEGKGNWKLPGLQYTEDSLLMLLCQHWQNFPLTYNILFICLSVEVLHTFIMLWLRFTQPAAVHTVLKSDPRHESEN